MSQSYTHIIDLAKEVEPPENGILTRTLFNDDNVKAVSVAGRRCFAMAKETSSDLCRCRLRLVERWKCTWSHDHRSNHRMCSWESVGL